MSVYYDDVFIWNSKDIFYFEKYNIPPEPDFIAHVLSRKLTDYLKEWYKSMGDTPRTRYW